MRCVLSRALFLAYVEMCWYCYVQMRVWLRYLDAILHLMKVPWLKLPTRKTQVKRFDLDICWHCYARMKETNKKLATQSIVFPWLSCFQHQAHPRSHKGLRGYFYADMNNVPSSFQDSTRSFFNLIAYRHYVGQSGLYESPTASTAYFPITTRNATIIIPVKNQSAMRIHPHHIPKRKPEKPISSHMLCRYFFYPAMLCIQPTCT